LLFRVFNPDLNFDLYNEVYSKVRTSLKEKKKEDHDDVMKSIKDILKNMDLITVFSSDSIVDLDQAILFAILKAEKSKLLKDKKSKDEKNTLLKQLKLALKWNRIDVAEKYIFNEDKLWEVN
jgi:hypothetical protein